jgi:hypothetical protein
VPTETPSTGATRTPTVPASASPTPSHGLLVNGGFEDVDETGALVGWRKQGGALGQVRGPVKAGTAAAGLSSDSTSTKWLYQTVRVTPGAWYEASAFVYDDSPWVDAAWLRVSWYQSGDGSGSALDDVDSTGELVGPAGAYRRLTTGPVQAPAGAQAARVRVMLRPRDATSAVIYVDEAMFAGTEAPAVPPIGEAPGTSRSRTGSSRGVVRDEGSAANSAEILDAARAAGPTPLIQRGAEVTPATAAASKASSWWPWLVPGCVAAAGVSGWCLWEAWRRRLLTRTRSRGRET